MPKHSEYEKKLKEEEKRIANDYEKILHDILFANIKEDSHKMLVGEEITKFYENKPLLDEISLLEKVELWDLFNNDRL